MVKLELKPCPFCGDVETEVHQATKWTADDNYNQWAVRCGWCGVLGPHCDTITKAVNAWNDRRKTKTARESTNG